MTSLAGARGGDAGPGEFELIDAIAARVGPTHDILGIGDDAAAWKPSPGKLQVATTDMLIEGVHFRLDWCSPEDLGWKALAASLSDIASMGADGGRALVSLALPPERRGIVAGLYAGFRELGIISATSIVGGDTTRSPGPVIVNVAIVGEAPPDALLRRDAAQPGEVLALTGAVGAAAAGLDLLGHHRDVPARARAEVLAAQLRPRPRLLAGKRIAAVGGRCAIDVSDGVLSEAWHIARASGVGIEIDAERVPVHPAAVEILGVDGALNAALTGGEDYELLFTAREPLVRRVAADLDDDPPVTVIGRVTHRVAGGSVTVLSHGHELSLPERGYVAF